MQLNIDCLRDVLLALEDALSVEIDDDGGVTSNSASPIEIAEALSDSYGEGEVYYALKLLGEARFIDKCVIVGCDGIWHFSTIDNISFAGHEFLEKIKPPSVWDKTREFTKKAGSASLSFVAQVASGFLTDLASGKFIN